MNSLSEISRAPAGLRTPGRRLWSKTVAVYELTPPELSLLEEACRTADELNRLELALRHVSELLTTGSMGQLRPHPLLAEVRAHRLLLERLSAALNLPDVDEQVGARGPSRHARKAAQARWSRRGDVGGDAS